MSAAFSLDENTIASVYAACRAESRQSLVKYLDRFTINSDPPRPWRETIAPYQLEMVKAIAPAFEAAEGIRSSFNGKRRFWWTLPRGHDKTGFLGRLIMHALAFSRHPIRAVAAAGDKDQAKLLTESMSAEQKLNPWVPVKVNKYDASGPTGELQILSSDAPTSSGKLATFYVIDELTYWKNRALWDILMSGVGKRPNAILIVITNAGILETWQWEIREAARTDPNWNFLEAPVRTCLATWINPEQRASDRLFLSAAHAERVYDNVWTSASDLSLLKYEEIADAYQPFEKGKPRMSLWRSPHEATKLDPGSGLYVGVDIGRTRDLTVITTIELTKSQKLIVREIVELENTPFKTQEAAIRAAGQRRGVRALRIDMGGIGMQLAETFTIEMPMIARGVAMGDTWMGQAALKLAVKFRTRVITIPDNPILHQDLQQVEEVGNTAGGVPVLHTKRSVLGHADRFWSIALAVDPMPTESEGKRSAPRPTGIAGRRKTVPGARAPGF